MTQVANANILLFFVLARLPAGLIALKGPPGKHCDVCIAEWCAPRLAAKHKLTWLVLGGDPAARSHRVEQFTAL